MSGIDLAALNEYARRDPEGRARLAQMAGLTDEERLAIDQWCDEQQREYETRKRRALEAHADDPLATQP